MEFDPDRIGEEEVKIAEAVADEMSEKLAISMDALMMGGAMTAPMLSGITGIGGRGLDMALDTAFDSYFVSDAVDRRTNELEGMRLDNEAGLGGFGSFGTGSTDDTFDIA